MTRYLSLAEYLRLAELVTGIPAQTLVATSRTELADSALHAPQASFGGHEFYPDLHHKAAVLVCRLARNHPLVDGNKRTAWLAMRMFIELNGGRWDPEPPDTDQAEAAMVAIAAGEADETWTTHWLRQRVQFPNHR